LANAGVGKGDALVGALVAGAATRLGEAGIGVAPPWPALHPVARAAATIVKAAVSVSDHVRERFMFILGFCVRHVRSTDAIRMSGVWRWPNFCRDPTSVPPVASGLPTATIDGDTARSGATIDDPRVTWMP